MDFIDGEPLGAGTVLELPDLLDCMIQAARALHALHGLAAR
jgi:hypothetical protein